MKSLEELEKEITSLKLELTQEKERRKIENKWFQTIIDSLPNPLFIKDSTSSYYATNAAFEKLLDTSKSDLLGKIDKDFFSDEEVEVFLRVDSEVLTNGETNWNEEKLTINNETRELLTSKARIEDSEGNKFILGLITDITDRKNQHIQLIHKKDQLEQEKNNVQILLKEVHHRVKNNMQVVSSLLSLQKERFENEEVQAAFMNCKYRISAMSNVHEILYRTENFSNLNFATYIETLVDKIKESYYLKDQIEFKLDIINVFLNVDIAVPLGLTINEIVINSIKHGIIEGKVLKIYIRLETMDGLCVLTVGDNGKGKHPNPEGENSTFGLELINLFCEQISAEIELVEDSEGVHYQLKFENRKIRRR